jgi:hypothetical protein
MRSTIKHEYRRFKCFIAEKGALGIGQDWMGNYAAVLPGKSLPEFECGYLRSGVGIISLDYLSGYPF